MIQAGWPRGARTSGIFAAFMTYSRLDIRISQWRLQDKRRQKRALYQYKQFSALGDMTAAQINRKLWSELTPFRKRVIAHIKESTFVRRVAANEAPIPKPQ
jgi:hypothetical protein